MAENQENIEARLCSYIDGDLSPAERAQLERTLAAHPEYVALLAELRQVRGLVRDLPRQRMPVEVTDAVQGHLERGLLLDTGVGQAQTIRFNYFSQFYAIAAILILAIGLGAVVYFVLPRNKSTQVARGPETIAAKTDDESHDRAFDQAKPSDQTLRDDVDATRRSAKGAQDGLGPVASMSQSKFSAVHPGAQDGLGAAAPAVPATSSTENLLATNPAPTAAPAPLAPRAMKSDMRKGDRELADAQALHKEQDRLRNAEAPMLPDQLAAAAQKAPLLLVVRAADLNQASGAVNAYLADNRILCQAVPDEAGRVTAVNLNGRLGNSSGNAYSANLGQTKAGDNDYKYALAKKAERAGGGGAPTQSAPSAPAAQNAAAPAPPANGATYHAAAQAGSGDQVEQADKSKVSDNAKRPGQFANNSIEGNAGNGVNSSKDANKDANNGNYANGLNEGIGNNSVTVNGSVVAQSPADTNRADATINGNLVDAFSPECRVILARMNLSQAQTMSRQLSEQPGQKTELLQENSPTGPEVAGNPDTNGEVEKALPSANPSAQAASRPDGAYVDRQKSNEEAKQNADPGQVNSQIQKPVEQHLQAQAQQFAGQADEQTMDVVIVIDQGAPAAATKPTVGK